MPTLPCPCPRRMDQLDHAFAALASQAMLPRDFGGTSHRCLLPRPGSARKWRAAPEALRSIVTSGCCAMKPASASTADAGIGAGTSPRREPSARIRSIPCDPARANRADRDGRPDPPANARSPVPVSHPAAGKDPPTARRTAPAPRSYRVGAISTSVPSKSSRIATGRRLRRVARGGERGSLGGNHRFEAYRAVRPWPASLPVRTGEYAACTAARTANLRQIISAPPQKMHHFIVMIAPEGRMP